MEESLLLCTHSVCVYGEIEKVIQELLSDTPPLTPCLLNRFSHTIYWKSPISILGTSCYEIYIFLEKNG